MRIEELSTGRGGGGGAPANYQQVSSAAFRSSSFNPGIESSTATSRCTSRLVVGSIVNEDPGDGPLSLWCQFRLPASLAANAGVCGLSPSETHILGGSGSDAIGLAIMSGDLNLVMGNSSTHTRYALGVASLVGQVVDVVITRSGSTLAAYVNGTAVTLTAVNVNGNVAPNATITATWAHALAPLSSTIVNSNVSTTGPVHRFVVYNRALSASEAGLLGILGVDVADQWGSKAELVNATTGNGGFETPGTGGADAFAIWTESAAGASTINRDTVKFFAGTASCRMDIDATGSSATINGTFLFARGKRYRVSAQARGTGTNPRLALNVGEVAFAAFGPVLNDASWQSISTEFVFAITGASLSLSVGRLFGAQNGSIWIDNLTVQRIGALLDLQFDGTCGFQAADRANQLDATLFNGAGFTIPDAHAGFARWIAAAPAGERMGGSAGIVIPANCSISRIVVTNLNVGDSQTFSLGSSAGTLGDIVSAAPLNGNGTVNVIDPGNSISTTGQLWISYTGAGSIKASVFFNPA